MDPLAKLFGTPVRLKLLRLFLFNAENTFTVADAAQRSKLSKDATRKEINALVAMKVLRKKGSAAKATYMADIRFKHFEALKSFLRATTGISDTDVVGNLRKAGALRLVTVTGLFTGAIEPKIDLLVVGDRLDDRSLGQIVHSLEAELGRELRYASFSTEEFRYRTGVYDRLLRDVFDYPHRTILDRIGA
ncbi:hypothetical protein K2Y00_03275 [Patescibacteria group bacterium]|nr:hypothetical protein [Patescibacteria group bacterium]